MRRSFYFLVFAIIPALAEIGSLVAPGDGHDVFFYSNLPLKGSGDPRQGRIFRMGPGGLTRIAAEKKLELPQPCPGTCLTNAYDLTWVDASRDGSIIAYTGNAECV